MTTRIEKNWHYNAGVYFSDKLLMNNYNLTLSMIVETDHVREQNIAMERLHYFISEVVDSCVFFDINDKKIQDYKNLNIKVCSLPEEPYDQIIGMVLLIKFNNILENKMIVTDLFIESKLGDNVKFHVVQEIAEAMFNGNNWWNNGSANLLCTTKENGKKTKIVKLFDDDWINLGLAWKDTKSIQKS